MSKRKSARRSRERSARRRSRQLSFESLESRVLLAVFNVPADMSLAAAITTADSTANSDAAEHHQPGDWHLRGNRALIQVPTTKTLSIVGQGTGVILQSDGSNRVLELNGNVVLQNLAIEGGKVQVCPSVPTPKVAEC